MKNTYDFLILNNCPSFYKINLYNQLALHSKIFVVFLGVSNQVIIDNNFKDNIKFDYYLLNDFQVEERSFIKTFSKLRKVVFGKEFKKIIYGGYIEKEFLLLSFLNSKDKNILQTESAAESKIGGIKGIIKSFILKRYSNAIVSGKAHAEVLNKLGFKGEISVSGGVGIFRKQFARPDKDNEDDMKFLYVGRLLKKKNVGLLIEVFNKNKLPLTIVGEGEMRHELQQKSKNNITFKGFCSNDEIHKIYSKHHIFILPSLSEPWGLVVEEALYNNCVLILSENVGSLHEMLIENNAGVSFNPYSTDSLSDAIIKVVQNYKTYYNNIKNIDFSKSDHNQVQQYLKLL